MRNPNLNIENLESLPAVDVLQLEIDSAVEAIIALTDELEKSGKESITVEDLKGYANTLKVVGQLAISIAQASQQ